MIGYVTYSGEFDNRHRRHGRGAMWCWVQRNRWEPVYIRQRVIYQNGILQSPSVFMFFQSIKDGSSLDCMKEMLFHVTLGVAKTDEITVKRHETNKAALDSVVHCRLDGLGLFQVNLRFKIPHSDQGKKNHQYKWVVEVNGNPIYDFWLAGNVKKCTMPVPVSRPIALECCICYRKEGIQRPCAQCNCMICNFCKNHQTVTQNYVDSSNFRCPLCRTNTMSVI